MRPRRILSKQQKPGADLWIAVFAILLSMFGLLMIFESSNVSAFRDFSDKFHYVREQGMSLLVSTVALFITARIPYKRYYELSVPLLLAAIISLFAVFLPGLGVNSLGASRWIRIGGFGFQPSELTKLAMIIYLSAWLSEKEKKRFGAFLILMGLIVGLVLLQPDLGTAVILSAIFLTIYFLSGAPLRHVGLLLPAFLCAGILLVMIAPYRFARLQTFFNPDADPLGSSYHVRQILISLGSGGFWGVGLGSSMQKYQYLPEASTDSIFAIMAEEFGFIGSALFIFVSASFLYKIFQVARNAPDEVSFLLASGILTFFACQYIINLGSMVVLFPLTGVPLPFISFGGTHLLISFIAVGILLNISRHSRQ